MISIAHLPPRHTAEHPPTTATEQAASSMPPKRRVVGHTRSAGALSDRSNELPIVNGWQKAAAAARSKSAGTLPGVTDIDVSVVLRNGVSSPMPSVTATPPSPAVSLVQHAAVETSEASFSQAIEDIDVLADLTIASPCAAPHIARVSSAISTGDEPAPPATSQQAEEVPSSVRRRRILSMRTSSVEQFFLTATPQKTISKTISSGLMTPTDADVVLAPSPNAAALVIPDSTTEEGHAEEGGDGRGCLERGLSSHDDNWLELVKANLASDTSEPAEGSSTQKAVQQKEAEEEEEPTVDVASATVMQSPPMIGLQLAEVAGTPLDTMDEESTPPVSTPNSPEVDQQDLPPLSPVAELQQQAPAAAVEVSDIADSPEPTPGVLRDWENQGVDEAEDHDDSLLQHSGVVLDVESWSIMSGDHTADEGDEKNEEVLAEHWASMKRVQNPRPVAETPLPAPVAVCVSGARLSARGAALSVVAYPPQPTADEMTWTSVVALTTAVGIGVACLTKSKGGSTMAASFDGSVAGHFARELGKWAAGWVK